MPHFIGSSIIDQHQRRALSENVFDCKGMGDAVVPYPIIAAVNSRKIFTGPEWI